MKTIREQANIEAQTAAAVINGYAQRIDRACEFAYHNYDADQRWVVDQMLRTLLGDEYEQWIKGATNDGAEDWDCGVAS